MQSSNLTFEFDVCPTYLTPSAARGRLGALMFPLPSLFASVGGKITTGAGAGPGVVQHINTNPLLAYTFHGRRLAGYFYIRAWKSEDYVNGQTPPSAPGGMANRRTSAGCRR